VPRCPVKIIGVIKSDIAVSVNQCYILV
jgi:hypothetical protein